MRLVLPRDPHARYLPFAVVGLLGQLSALWPPGPDDVGVYWASTAVFVVATVMLVRWPRWPGGTLLVTSGTYIASVSLLMISTGGVNSGLGALLLAPVVGVAVYGEVWESAVVVGLDLAALTAVSVVAGSYVAAAGPRRLFFFTCIAVLLSISIQALRRRLLASNRRARQLLRQAEAGNDAVRRLVALTDPAAITALGVELAVNMVFSLDAEVRRACYYRVLDGCVEVQDLFDESGQAEVLEQEVPAEYVFEDDWLLKEHPGLRQVVSTLQPLAAPLDPAGVGPRLRRSLEHMGVTYGAWTPVCLDGTLHGVLGVAGQDKPVPPESLSRLVALGHILELALSNWSAHERLKEQATLEERRRIARELHDGLAHELAFIASKTRGARSDGSGNPVDVRALAGAADRALDEARRAITVLSVPRPQSVDVAVAQTAEDMAERFGMAVDLELAEGVEVPAQVTESLLRIVREALTNAATHGGSEHVAVRLEHCERLRLVVEDDGCGFDPGLARGNGGFGLLSMEERAASVGAELVVDSVPDHGTRITVEFP